MRGTSGAGFSTCARGRRAGSRQLPNGSRRWRRSRPWSRRGRAQQRAGAAGRGELRITDPGDDGGRGRAPDVAHRGNLLWGELLGRKAEREKMGCVRLNRFDHDQLARSKVCVPK